MQQLQPLVANAKLDRPLNSHPSLSHELMLTQLEADDWGDIANGTQDEYQEQEYPQPADDVHDPQEQESELHYPDPGTNKQGYE